MRVTVVSMTQLRVLHVVATTQRRGAEIFAADLVRALDGLGTAQQVASLRPAQGPSVDFDAPTHILGGGAAAHAGSSPPVGPQAAARPDPGARRGGDEDLGAGSP